MHTSEYQKRKLKGVCVGCGKNPPAVNRVRCQLCLLHMRELVGRRYASMTPIKKKKLFNQMKELLKNPEKRRRWNELNAKRRLRLKKEVMNHYGGVCSCCGEKHVEFLTLDHVNNDGITHRKQEGFKSCTGIDFYRRLKIRNYDVPFKMVILCAKLSYCKKVSWNMPHKLKKRNCL